MCPLHFFIFSINAYWLIIFNFFSKYEWFKKTFFKRNQVRYKGEIILNGIIACWNILRIFRNVTLFKFLLIDILSKIIYNLYSLPNYKSLKIERYWNAQSFQLTSEICWLYFLILWGILICHFSTHASRDLTTISNFI